MRKFNLAVQKIFITFKIDKTSQAYFQFKETSLFSKEEKADTYLTLAVIFFRVNAAYLIQKTIEEFIEHNNMKNVTVHIDFLLEYSIYY